MKAVTGKHKLELPAQELSILCAQLSLLVKAGIPLDDGMQSIGETMSRDGAQLMEQIRTTYQEAYSLRAALERAGVFPRYLVNMVEIGETSGSLEEVLDGLAVYYEHQSNVMRHLRQAILQPTLSIFTMAIVVGVLVWKVVPIFTGVMNRLGGSVSALAAMGPALGKLVLACLVLLLLAIAGCVAMVRLGKGKKIVALFAHIPAVNRTKQKLFAARFASVLSMLLAGGYPVDRAMACIPSILDDSSFVTQVNQIGQRVEQGENLADVLKEENVFPGLYAGMVAVGDKTGRMDDVLKKLGAIYQREALEEVDNLVSLIEPALVGVLSACVGVILFSVMLPLLGIMSAIG